MLHISCTISSQNLMQCVKLRSLVFSTQVNNNLHQNTMLHYLLNFFKNSQTETVYMKQELKYFSFTKIFWHFMTIYLSVSANIVHTLCSLAHHE